MSFLLMDASSVSGRLSFGPELENSVLPLTGVASLPLIAPVDLLKSMLLTLSSSTWFTNCEYVRSVFDELPPARLLTMNAAAISASTIHGTQRNDGELPPPVGGRRSLGGRSPGGPSSGGPDSGGPPGGRVSGRHAGGGVGGRPLGAPNDSGSPVSGSTPGSRSVWRRLILGRLLVVVAPCYGPARAVRRSGKSGLGREHGLRVVNTRVVRSIPLVGRRSRSRSHRCCQ